MVRLAVNSLFAIVIILHLFKIFLSPFEPLIKLWYGASHFPSNHFFVSELSVILLDLPLHFPL